MFLKTGRINGRGEWIRTTGLLVPNQALYQAEPRPEHIDCTSLMPRNYYTAPTGISRRVVRPDSHHV